MPLNEMTLQTLARLADDIDAVRAAMAILEDRGLTARAGLLPGAPMRITVQQRMPEMFPKNSELEPEFERVSIADAFRDAPTVCDDAPVSFQPLAEPDPFEAQRAAGPIDNEGFAIEPAPITAEAPPEGNAGESVVPAPEPAVTGPGEAVAKAADPGPQPAQGRWTEEETAGLVEIIADRMERRGDTLRAAAESAAAILGRPTDGTYFKARSLVERIDAERRVLVDRTLDRLAPAASVPTPAATVPTPEAKPQAEPAPAAPVFSDVPLTPTGELHQHLALVKRDKLWTLDRDHDLMHFSQLQWPAGDIALEIKVPVAEIKPRFAVLTAARKFKAADVLAALAAMLGAQAA